MSRIIGFNFCDGSCKFLFFFDLFFCWGLDYVSDWSAGDWSGLLGGGSFWLNYFVRIPEKINNAESLEKSFFKNNWIVKWEGHKILKNLPLIKKVILFNVKTKCSIFSNFCGLLRIYELYDSYEVPKIFCSTYVNGDVMKCWRLKP